MTLIHDYDGNPNDTYYTSKALPAGWTVAGSRRGRSTPTTTPTTATSPITKATYLSDNTVFAQLVVDLGVDKMNHDRPRDGDHLAAGAEPVGGARRRSPTATTPLQMADAYATIANGGVHHRATIIDKIVWPDGHARYFGNSKGTRVFTYGQTYAADQVLKQVLTAPGATGRRTELGLPGGRQDRHRREPRQRLVRRLHPADLDRRLGRLPAGQHPDQQRFRRLLRRADLAGLHGVGGRRLLRRLDRAGRSRSRGPPSPARHSSSGRLEHRHGTAPTTVRDQRPRRPAAPTPRHATADHPRRPTLAAPAAHRRGGGGAARRRGRLAPA